MGWGWGGADGHGPTMPPPPIRLLIVHNKSLRCRPLAPPPPPPPDEGLAPFGHPKNKDSSKPLGSSYGLTLNIAYTPSCADPPPPPPTHTHTHTVVQI